MCSETCNAINKVKLGHKSILNLADWSKDGYYEKWKKKSRKDGCGWKNCDIDGGTNEFEDNGGIERIQ